MAIISKERARKPLVEAPSWTGVKTKWVPSEDTPGHLRAAGDLYTLALNDRPAEGPSTMYEIALTEDEMLHTITEWLKTYENLRADRRRAENAKTNHHR